MIALKQYQIRARDTLLSRSESLLSGNGEKRIIFQAPTGSGKTIIMADFLANLSQASELSSHSFCFIWAAPRKLHIQSKQKLTSFYADSQALVCREFFELSGSSLMENEILFLNWESINKSDSNTIVLENEREFYLKKIIEKSLAKGLTIVLIIDESHHHATSDISKQLIADMSPKLTIEVSATPILENPDEIVKIALDDVKAEGMIKKNVVLNEGIENVLSGNRVSSKLAKGSNSFILNLALEKRIQLRDSFKAEGSGVNPLLLIQFPDRRSGSEESVKSEIIELLRCEYGITTENGKLGIYLSEEKANLEDIASNGDATEVLIFKQAIALGWDCPRAHVLLLFREHKSLDFSIQTVGRVMRMPEPYIGHYLSEDLNLAYVFTNIDEISIYEEAAQGYLTVFSSHRREDLSPLNLASVYSFRQRERTRLSSKFVSIFQKVASTYKLEQKIVVQDQHVFRNMIGEETIGNIEGMVEHRIQGTLSVEVVNQLELQTLFDGFLRDNLSPFHPEHRSIGRLKESLYDFFKRSLKIDYSLEQDRILKIILSQENISHFINVIDEAKEDYLNSLENSRQPLVSVDNWNIPENLNFSSEYSIFKAKKSAMQPLYVDRKFKTEQAFMEYLEKAKGVEWWFRNGERDSTFFAVPYEENEVAKPFYIDFIIKLQNGSIFLADTKRGQTVQTAKEKSDGLQEYCGLYKGIQGGIVDNTKVDFTGRWMYFAGSGDELREGDFQNWELLEF